MMINKFLFSAVLLVGLGTGGDRPPSSFEKSPTYGKPAEAFVTGCDLIWRGKDVPKVMEDGKLGYKIVKRSDAVLINGMIYVQGLARPPAPEYIEPKIVREAAVRESAIEYLYRTMERREGAVAVAGQTHPLGVPFALTVPDSGHVVRVTFSKDGNGVLIKYGNDETSYPAKRPVPIPDEVRLERRLDVAYRTLLADLRPGVLVVMGSGGGPYIFPLHRAHEVRASLSRIPSQAKVLYVDTYYDQVIYAPIHDGDFVWTSDVIQGLVRPEGK